MDARVLLRLIGSAVVLLCMAAAGFGQARVTGTAPDNAGGVVVGAPVEVKNVETGQTPSSLTNQSGVYSIAFLNPGQYELSRELSGFKRFTPSGLVVETGTTTTRD